MEPLGTFNIVATPCSWVAPLHPPSAPKGERGYRKMMVGL